MTKRTALLWVATYVLALTGWTVAPLLVLALWLGPGRCWVATKAVLLALHRTMLALGWVIEHVPPICWLDQMLGDAIDEARSISPWLA